jgi:hypothetical protein
MQMQTSSAVGTTDIVAPEFIPVKKINRYYNTKIQSGEKNQSIL